VGFGTDVKPKYKALDVTELSKLTRRLLPDIPPRNFLEFMFLPRKVILVGAKGPIAVHFPPPDRGSSEDRGHGNHRLPNDRFDLAGMERLASQPCRTLPLSWKCQPRSS
jgi:hypothetical protein